MYCNQCGKQVGDGAQFCENCGARLPAAPVAPTEKTDQNAFKTQTPLRFDENRFGYPNAPAAPPTARETSIGKNITLCQDGKYRWVYEVGLFKNPTYFLLIWKIFFSVFLGIFVFIMILDAIQNSDFFPDMFLTNLKVFGYFIIGMTVIVGISYCIYAAIMGGKYCVIFEMDENGINHKQMPKQAKKANLISALTVLGGIAAGNLSTVGVGLISARTEMYSEFAKTRKVKAYPRRELIKVNGLLSHNQVYAEKEDFEFVKDYILSRCTNIK